MIRPRAYALTARRIAAASAYVQEHVTRSNGGHPMVADRYETPRDVQRTLTRIYGSHRIPGDGRGEVAYWMIDDGGAGLGIDVTS